VLLRLAIALVLLAGCGGDDELCRVGDPSLEVELELVQRTADGEMVPLEDGAVLPVQSPPQGGKVAFVGVRVRNADVCGSQVQAALRDPCQGGRVIGIESRPVAWRLADDGFAEPAQPAEISDYTNVPLCPSSALESDLDGHLYQLEVRFYQADGSYAERLVDVTLTCADADDPAGCRCECDADYDEAAECPADPDGGIVDCP
jgi:hypothetical protein